MNKIRFYCVVAVALAYLSPPLMRSSGMLHWVGCLLGALCGVMIAQVWMEAERCPT